MRASLAPDAPSPVARKQTAIEKDLESRKTEAGGYSCRKESAALISAANKGKVPSNKGKARSTTEKKNISKGRSREHNLKILRGLGKFNAAQRSEASWWTFEMCDQLKPKIKRAQSLATKNRKGETPKNGRRARKPNLEKARLYEEEAKQLIAMKEKIW